MSEGTLRWHLDEAGPQGALFPDAERHVGRGEFRGMEFLHVQAKRILNTLAKSGRLPFRHTINAYRGCSHACTYCFARPTHDYLGLDIDEGFERQIVVKVNAVERLRAELDPRRWRGEAIAMGTNTDPYQRCEGKYHLTKGLIGVLSDACNPFSILTKSPLVLRDVELLAEASARTDVIVNLSIGTLDEDVWRATEPGTAPPAKRVEAVTRLRDAGVRCGVLVAPVLPGLSDRAEQIDAVVKACVDAGAASISGGMLLYLKPGVKEVFMDHLRTSHPALVGEYEALYPRTYAPRALQTQVSGHLQASIARHRGTAVAFARNRTPTPGTRAEPAALPPAEQLGWGF